jgi:gas vesicle protein
MLLRKRSDLQRNLLALAAGLGAGVGLGILLAPKSGRDLRRAIGRKTGKGVSAVADGAEHLQERALGLAEKSWRAVEREKSRLVHAIDAGKTAYQAAAS